MWAFVLWKAFILGKTTSKKIKNLKSQNKTSLRVARSVAMKKVIIASKNPVKINATKKAFEKVFPTEQFEFIGIQVPSFVSDQPMSDEETLEGAINRAENAKLARKDAHFWVGIEGGIETNGIGMDAFGWIIVLSEHRLGQARSCTFPLPPYVARAVNTGQELGHVNDAFFLARD